MQLAPRKFHHLILSAPLALLGILAGLSAINLPLMLEEYLDWHPAAVEPFRSEGIVSLVYVFAWVLGISCAGLAAAGLAGIVRTRLTLKLLRKGYLLVYLVLLLYAWIAYRATGVLYSEEVQIGGTAPGPIETVQMRFSLLWHVALLGFIVLLLHVLSWRRQVINWYTGEDSDRPAPGDYLLENVRTWGRDSRYRKSWASSALAHVLVIGVLPFLVAYIGCVDPYLIPKGSGEPVVTLVKIVKPKKKKKKKYVLNPNSAIYIHIPDLDESKILEQVDEDTQLTYAADTEAVHGKMGQGGPGEGGWPEGMEGAVVRFVRLEYRGGDWDDGMTEALGNADVNFLDEFHDATGFKVAKRPESHAIRLLAKYDKGYAPPFVYMTGNSNIRVSERDRKILREYLLDGGMLFADAGSRRFDRYFRQFIQSVLPGQRLLTIADDDEIHLRPYAFPNGPPPLWHHGGYKPLGMKVKGRWVVYYHPGDVNDAWKDGHSGVSPSLAKASYQLGINIVYYAFTHYLEETAKYRK